MSCTVGLRTSETMRYIKLNVKKSSQRLTDPAKHQYRMLIVIMVIYQTGVV